MVLPDESCTLNIVELNYQHIEDNKISPVTIHLPGYIAPAARVLNIHGKLIQVIMMSQLRRSFDARIAANRTKRNH